MVKIYVKNYGVMSFQLDYENAPISCKNFVDLAKSGYYEGLIFHRIIKGFMIQGGGYAIKDNKLIEKEKVKPIKGEFIANGVNNTLKHERGVISMARTNVKDSATSQFFVVHKTSPHLDGQYAAFGKMIDGFECLDKIAGVRKDHYNDFPYELIEIEKVEVIDE